jgi:hypothetical protein
MHERKRRRSYNCASDESDSARFSQVTHLLMSMVELTRRRFLVLEFGGGGAHSVIGQRFDLQIPPLNSQRVC